MLRVIFLTLSVLFSGSVSADKPIAPQSIDGTSRLSAEQAVALILNTPGLVIIDARRPEEFDRGHIENSISLLDNRMTRERLAQIAPDPNTPILVYCNGERCMRSTNASEKLVEWGYRHVYWFRGGWQEWVANGLPVSR